MTLKFPSSMEECFYFTRRALDNGGKVVAWVFREQCPKCKKAIMGKPVEKGKVKIRAKEYICPACNYTVSKDEYEPTLAANFQYICPKCKNAGETQSPYKRITYMGAKALVFPCSKCGEKIAVTKKMKELKKKGGQTSEDDDMMDED